MIADLPFATADLPGIGGTIRERFEDFEVEEIPAYQPSGTGPHLYLWIEKCDISAEFLTKQIAQRLGIRPADIGMAGMKDRQAVTRQWVSVPESAEPRITDVDRDGIRVLNVSRHGNKLRVGHLHGNRFRILVRHVTAANALDRAQAIVESIKASGLPNFYGPQRFGRDGETATLGMAMLRRQTKAHFKPFLKKLALSAGQSVLFNEYLSRRMRDGLVRTVMLGDALAKWPAGGMFTCADQSIDQSRFDNREIVSAGPMFGTKLFAVLGVVAEREAEVLKHFDLTPDSFSGFGNLLDGTRRHNLIYVDDLHVVQEPDGLRFVFSLPAGSYATVLLREVIKSEPEA